MYVGGVQIVKGPRRCDDTSGQLRSVHFAFALMIESALELRRFDERTMVSSDERERY